MNGDLDLKRYRNDFLIHLSKDGRDQDEKERRGRHLSEAGSAINLDRHRFLRVEGDSGNAASANRFKWLRIGSHRRV